MAKPPARSEASMTAEMDPFMADEMMHSKAVKALFTAGIVAGWCAGPRLPTAASTLLESLTTT